MKIRVLGCYGGSFPGGGMTSFLVNDTMALDAGGVSGALSLRGQARLRDVLVSHSHFDHTCTLPFLVDNNFGAPGFCLRVHAVAEVIAAIKAHLFNDRTWPDFTRLPTTRAPVLRLITIPEERPFKRSGLRIRAVPVTHVVPTTGFFLDDGTAAVGFSSDTGPTHRFWEVANATRRLRAVITETSFPNSLEALALVSGHLTPAMLAREVAKLRKDVPVYLYGSKPRYVARIRREVQALGDSRIRLLFQGRTYHFR